MLYSIQFSSVIPQENMRYTITKGDSAASSHYFASQDKGILSHVRPNNPPTTTILPNQSCIQAHQQGNISIPSLSNKATNTKIFENLNHSLLLLGQLCDNGCTLVLTKHDLVVTKKNKQILKGIHSTTGDGLWDTPFPQNNIQQNNTNDKNEKNIQTQAHTKNLLKIILRRDKHAHKLAAYLHATCFSPVKLTFLKAKKQRFFLLWPGLNSYLITKHIVTPISTLMWHIKQEQQGFCYIPFQINQYKKLMIPFFP